LGISICKNQVTNKVGAIPKNDAPSRSTSTRKKLERVYMSRAEVLNKLGIKGFSLGVL
jgi:hypothetical protein